MTMNKLIADIVEAVGGTVRNNNNRNMLLEDWLDAYPKIRNVYTFNGVNNYIETGVKLIDADNMDGLVISGNWSLSDGTLVSQSVSSSRGDREFHIYFLSGTLFLVAGGYANQLPVSHSGNGVLEFRFSGSSSPLNLAVTDNGIKIYDGDIIIGTAREGGATFKVNARGAGAGSVGFFKGGVVRDVDISGGLIDALYPIDDGWNNNPNIRNARGDADATLINGMESGWSTINV